MSRSAVGAGRVFLLCMLVLTPLLISNLDNPLARTPVADAMRYDTLAAQIADQGLASQGVFYQAPLYPLLLSMLYRVGDEASRVHLVVLFQLVLLAAACACWLPVCRRLFDDPRIGYVTAGLALLHGPFAFHGLKLLPVTLALATQLLLLWLALRAAEHPTAGRLSLAGLAGGMAALARAESLLLLVLLLAALVFLYPRRLRVFHAAVVLLLTLAVVAPATLHNVRQGDFVLIASSAGENLFIGNQRGADGGHTPLHSQASDIESQRILAGQLATRAVGRELRPSEVSRYWATRARGEILAAPGPWLGIEAAKLRRTLLDADPTDLYSLSLERRLYVGWLYLLFIPASVLMAAALLGGIRLFRGGGLRRAAPLLAMLVGHLAVLMAFFVSTRLRLPFYFLLCPLAAQALVSAFDDWTYRRRLAVVVAIGFGLLLTLSPFVGRADEREQLRLAAVLSRQDRLPESLELLGPLLTDENSSDAVFDQACWVAFKQEDWDQAGRHCREAIERGIHGMRGCAVQTRLGRIEERLGHHGSAQEWHTRAVNGDCPLEARIELARFQARRGSREATEWLRRIGAARGGI